MIAVEGLTKFYGQIPAIQQVSFSAEQGEIIGFLGPNGAGKTTTMRILTGYTPATSGTAQIAGYDIDTHPLEVKRRIGYMPETVPLYYEMLVASFLHYVAEVKGVPRRQRRAEVERVMERAGLEEMGRRVIGHLSKGYRQRVGLAQALIGSPSVLILDEPTVGLDPRQIIEIRKMIRSLAEDHTVLLSTHILPEVQMICERVLIIHRGRIVAQDTMENLAGGRDDTLVLEVEIAGPEQDTMRVLNALPGVDDVKGESGSQYRVTLRKHGDLKDGEAAAVLADAVVKAGLRLHRLEERKRTLEEVFVEAISTEENAA